MFLKISDAANLGIHALCYMAERFEDGRPVVTSEAADAFGVSANHLSKVLQRLNRAGIVKSIRGPKGGFVLAKTPAEITLRRIYEAIDGELNEHTSCMLGTNACGSSNCIFGSLVDDVQRRVSEQFTNVTLASIIETRPAVSN